MLFFSQFNQKISCATISTILQEAGLSWQKLERRAIQIQMSDILRFAMELSEIPWLPQMLVFLDEVSFDRSDMLRKNGYGVKGQRLLYRGEFSRKSRASLLCFLGLGGILDTYLTEGTFTRLKFLDCCREFALNKASQVQTYPGMYSVWILDGARIHCDENLGNYFPRFSQILRSASKEVT